MRKPVINKCKALKFDCLSPTTCIKSTPRLPRPQNPARLAELDFSLVESTSKSLYHEYFLLGEQPEHGCFVDSDFELRLSPSRPRLPFTKVLEESSTIQALYILLCLHVELLSSHLTRSLLSISSSHMTHNATSPWQSITILSRLLPIPSNLALYKTRPETCDSERSPTRYCYGNQRIL